MNLVDKYISANNLTPSQVSKIISNIKLTDTQRKEYASLFIDTIMDDKTLFEEVPPRVLADAYLETKSLISGTKKKKEKEAHKSQILPLKID